MSKYLSQEWQDEVQGLSAQQPPQPGITVRTQYRVNGGPAGDVEYYWVVEDGRVTAAKLGVLAEADFTVTLTYDDSAHLQQGTLDPNAAFMQGKMKVSGNMAKMMSLLPLTMSPSWKAFQDDIRAVTEY